MRRPSHHTPIAVIRLLALWFAGLLAVGTRPAAAQQGAPADTIRRMVPSDGERLYLIKRLRAERLLIDRRRDPASPPLPADLKEIMDEAQQWAGIGEYDLAVSFIDEVLLFLETTKKTQPATPVASPFSAQMVSGYDLWQQRYTINLTDQDSVLREDEGNPFIGLRFSWQPDGVRRTSRRASLDLRHSRDYASGYSDYYHRFALTPATHLLIDHRLEGTWYYDEPTLRYVHQRLQTGVSRAFGRATTAIENEWQLRNYINETSLFTTFWQNQTTLRWWRDLPLLSRTELRYDLRRRRYPHLPVQDYAEHLGSLIVWPDVLKKAQFFAYTQYKERRYDRPFVDSLFTNPYGEWYHESSLKIETLRNLYLHAGATLNLRRYRRTSEYMPDYSDAAIESAFSFNLGTHASLKAGYRYRARRHRFSDGGGGGTAELEDFYSHAPLTQIDLIWGRLLLNLSQVYEIRRYPHAPQGGLSIYADRNVHSLLLLLSWNASRRWEVNFIGNIDDDMARNPEDSDSRSNLLNFELLYKF